MFKVKKTQKFRFFLKRKLKIPNFLRVKKITITQFYYLLLHVPNKIAHLHPNQYALHWNRVDFKTIQFLLLSRDRTGASSSPSSSFGQMAFVLQSDRPYVVFVVESKKGGGDGGMSGTNWKHMMLVERFSLTCIFPDPKVHPHHSFRNTNSETLCVQ